MESHWLQAHSVAAWRTDCKSLNRNLFDWIYIWLMSACRFPCFWLVKISMMWEEKTTAVRDACVDHRVPAWQIKCNLWNCFKASMKFLFSPSRLLDRGRASWNKSLLLSFYMKLFVPEQTDGLDESADRCRQCGSLTWTAPTGNVTFIIKL